MSLSNTNSTASGSYQEMDVIQAEVGIEANAEEQNLEAKIAAVTLNCDICKKFSTSSFRVYSAHVKKHQQDNDFVVDIALKKQVRSGRVRRKHNIGSRSKKFRLHSTNLTLNAQLSNSQLVLPKTAKLVCPHCKFTADKFSNLSIHVKRKHTNLIQPQSFMCQRCHFSAASRQLLQAHLNELSHYERKCQICNEAFEGNSQYLDHLGLHFSGISVSPIKCSGTKNVESKKVSSLHDALKEAALLESEVRTNAASWFFSKGKSRSLPLVQDISPSVFNSSLTSRICSAPSSKTTMMEESDVKMDMQPSVLGAATETEMCIDSVTCNVETQTEGATTAKMSTNELIRGTEMSSEISTKAYSSQSQTNSLLSESSDSKRTQKVVTKSSDNGNSNSTIMNAIIGASNADAKGPETAGEKLESTVNSTYNTTKSSDDKAIQEYTCVHCDITFRDKVLFTVHRGSHGFKNPFSCNLCGTELSDKYEFAAHFHCT